VLKMARYVYFCAACNQKFEVDKPMAQSGQAEPCPKCQSMGERVFTSPGITIKGAPIKFKDGDQLMEKGGCDGCDHHGCDIKPH
jgi:putative FmdB family regulatory protein